MASELLAQAIEKAGSARALAELLGQKEQAVSNWKRGRAIPDDALAWIAEYVGEDHIAVLAKEKGGLWKKLATATTAAVLITGSALPADGYTKTIETTIFNSLCILCQILD
ncbi:MAG: helix-turn-helix domain-containing protein [Burkholderiales bacterium]|nr:helix-turn-helix domain-containing protein [Burkholderiales bacterium]